MFKDEQWSTFELMSLIVPKDVQIIDFKDDYTSSFGTISKPSFNSDNMSSTSYFELTQITFIRQSQKTIQLIQFLTKYLIKSSILVQIPYIFEVYLLYFWVGLNRSMLSFPKSMRVVERSGTTQRYSVTNQKLQTVCLPWQPSLHVDVRT